jgi:ribose/xylose/arabinose/galactoside ABC-type transport system permease subunit
VKRFGPLAGLFLVYLLFVLIGPESFGTARTLETIARQTAIVGTAALGMTMVIISGGIDLSVGSIVALSSVIVALVLNSGSGGPLLAIAAAAAAGAACGLLSGTLITRLRVAPFIVTLGMLLLIRGGAKGLGKEQKVDAPLSWLVDLLSSLPRDRQWWIVPPGIWLLALLAFATAFLLRYTKLGAHLFAIGSNEETARLCGVRVERVKTTVYSLSGALAGLSGVLQFSRLTVGDPTVAVGLELDVIAAVVIGGGSLAGGEGTVLGTLVGAFIMTVIRTGTAQMGLPNWVQEIVTGAIIVAAVAIDRWRHRKADE